jgi:transposase
MKIMRAYKYRLYPTPEQEARLSAWVAAVRAVYKAAL